MTTPCKEQIPLIFKGDDVRLFARLRQAAKANRRTLTDEILYRLERSLNADATTQEV
jgi:hypothetical protein